MLDMRHSALILRQSASEATALWRYRSFIIIIIFFTPGSKDPRG